MILEKKKEKTEMGLLLIKNTFLNVFSFIPLVLIGVLFIISLIIVGMKLIADRFWGSVSDLISNWGAVTVHMNFKQETQPQRKVIKQ